MHHTYTIICGIVGVSKCDALPIQIDFTLARFDNASNNVHQRAFSRTVFTNYGMNSSPHYFEINLVIGD
ncbi:hypothetical protein SDC9_100780 [bioreactor metagenome]|uniref:Uncharacterized protein n=1 Tax=bioreactor metagenome TaxID=1076179 RepID=A0A645AMN1_9ZZZZ